jgi:selenocysteine-specific translation elongation factor
MGTTLEKVLEDVATLKEHFEYFKMVNQSNQDIDELFDAIIELAKTIEEGKN